MKLKESKLINLYEEVEDGTIDDIAGEGYWHLEKMREGVFSLTFGDGKSGEFQTIHIEAEDGDIKVKDYSN